MQVSVVSASSQTCRGAIEALLADGSVKVVGHYRDLKKVPSQFKDDINFTAVYGDLDVPSSLDFRGSTAVLTISPPRLDGSDYIAAAREIAANVRKAALDAGSVQRLVYISSMGAQHDHGVGEVKTNNLSEKIYHGSVPEVIFIRSGYYMENWVSSLDSIMSSHPHFYSTIVPIDYTLPMVSVRDIGKTCAHALLLPSEAIQSEKIINLSGPQDYCTRDVQVAFEKVLGTKVEVRLVERDQLAGFFSQVLPAHAVSDFVEMTESFLPGGLLEKDMVQAENVMRGKDTLVDAIAGMVAARKQVGH